MKPRFSTTFLRYAFFSITLLVATEIIVDLYHAQTVREDVERMVGVYNKKVTLVHQLRSLVRERMITVNAMLLADDPFVAEEHYEQLLELGNQFILKRRELERISREGSAEEQRIVAEITHLGQTSKPLISRVVAKVRGDEPRDARRELLATIVPRQQRMLTLSESIFHYYLQQVNRQGARLVEADRKWLLHDAIMGGVTLLLIMVIGMHVVQRIERKQRQLALEIDEREQLEKEMRLSRDRLDDAVRVRTCELAHRTEQLSEAQRLTQMGCWEWDIGADRLIWSEELHEILGLPQGETPTFAGYLQRVHPEDRSALEQARQRLPLGEEYRLDYRLQRADGETIMVHERAVIERLDEQGRPDYILGTVQDISERKEVEDKLRLTASVVANTGDGVMITDSDNRILEINRAFSEILGYSEEEIVGQSPSMLKSTQHDAGFYRDMWQTLAREGEWQGEIWDRHRDGSELPLWMTINAVRDEHGQLRHYVALFRDISQAKKTERKLWHTAHHDLLTGLPNRNLLYDRLRMALADAAREGGRVAVMLLDLDGFKEVNDTHGHSVGDSLLIEVAERLRRCIRESDTVARFAGDEFVIVLKDLAADEDVRAIVRKIEGELQRERRDSVHGGVIEASIGVALYPDDAPGEEALLNQADKAMYRAKREGKGRSRFAGES